MLLFAPVFKTTTASVKAALQIFTESIFMRNKSERYPGVILREPPRRCRRRRCPGSAARWWRQRRRRAARSGCRRWSRRPWPNFDARLEGQPGDSNDGKSPAASHSESDGPTFRQALVARQRPEGKEFGIAVVA